MKKIIINLTVSLLSVFAPMSAQAAANYDRNAAVQDTVWYDSREYAGQRCPIGSSGGGASTPLSGDDHVAAVFNFLVSKGLTPQQAAGAIGNIIIESYGIEPQRLQGYLHDLIPADQIEAKRLDIVSQTGWGIVQWTPYTKITDYAKSNNLDPNSMAVQLDFLWQQLTTNEANALAQLKATGTPEDAAYAWGKYYERPYSLADTLIERQVNAIAVYEYMVNKTPLPPTIAAMISTSPLTGSTGSGSTPTASGCPGSSGGGGGGTIAGYKNPFRDWPGITPYRIDSGVDYDGQSGPIYSIGNATITYINRSPSYAYNFLIYKFTDGPAAGLSLYISEQCAFPANLHVGDAITADTVVCNFLPTSPVIGIEIGWTSMPGGSFNISWNNTVTGGGGTTTSNAGLDMNRLLVKLGAPSGIDYHNGPGDTPPPPADWPVW